jgi:transposase
MKTPLLFTLHSLSKGEYTMSKIDQIIIDDFIDYIHEGLTYRQISEKFDVKLSTLADFVAKPEHSARVKAALQSSADTYTDKAEQILIEAKSTLVEIQRAKELSQFYRWKASKRNPKVFGDKVDVTTDGKQVKTVIKIGYGKPDPE